MMFQKGFVCSLKYYPVSLQRKDVLNIQQKPDVKQGTFVDRLSYLTWTTCLQVNLTRNNLTKKFVQGQVKREVKKLGFEFASSGSKVCFFQTLLTDEGQQTENLTKESIKPDGTAVPLLLITSLFQSMFKSYPNILKQIYLNTLVNRNIVPLELNYFCLFFCLGNIFRVT